VRRIRNHAHARADRRQIDDHARGSARIRRVDIDAADPRYRRPLERSVQRLVRVLPKECDIVLLGSIATGKYIDIFLKHFKERLRFPTDFVGRGDMSRGGLMLRCAADRQELPYVSVAGAVLNGKRPPKLAPRRYPKNSLI